MSASDPDDPGAPVVVECMREDGRTSAGQRKALATTESLRLDDSSDEQQNEADKDDTQSK